MEAVSRAVSRGVAKEEMRVVTTEVVTKVAERVLRLKRDGVFPSPNEFHKEL